MVEPISVPFPAIVSRRIVTSKSLSKIRFNPLMIDSIESSFLYETDAPG